MTTRTCAWNTYRYVWHLDPAALGSVRVMGVVFIADSWNPMASHAKLTIAPIEHLNLSSKLFRKNNSMYVKYINSIIGLDLIFSLNHYFLSFFHTRNQELYFFLPIRLPSVNALRPIFSTRNSPRTVKTKFTAAVKADSQMVVSSPRTPDIRMIVAL